ncbi:MAG: hypothetical protein IKU94_06850 [Bacteroidaceae bacterium]|nr:hypothetical protein [Bacteroidaceae bacterium]
MESIDAGANVSYNARSNTKQRGGRFVYKREFEQEVQEKKKLAQQNRRRTGWGERRSKAFKQPELTEKEIEERHGKIMEYKIGQPITWAEFRSYPREMQQEWANTFARKFDCGGKGIAIATGTSPSSVFTYFNDYGLTLPEGTGKYSERKGEEIRAWAERPEPAPVKVEKPEPKKTEPKKPELPYYVNTIRNGTMELQGNATEIFHTLFSIFRDAQLKLDMYFTVVPPEPTVEETHEPMQCVEPTPEAPDPTEPNK